MVILEGWDFQRLLLFLLIFNLLLLLSGSNLPHSYVVIYVICFYLIVSILALALLQDYVSQENAWSSNSSTCQRNLTYRET